MRIDDVVVYRECLYNPVEFGTVTGRWNGKEEVLDVLRVRDIDHT